MFDDRPIRHYLREMPSRHKFLYGEDAKRALLRTLFTFVSSNGKYLSYFFPHGHPPVSQEWKLYNDDEDKSHAGRPCMHRFHKGEPTYRCKECGLDDTCVLCWRCFNGSDHVGHNVTVSISQKDGGGVCDCGDPEAWKQDINCKYFLPPNTVPELLPQDLVECIKGTVAAILDYVIDVMSCSPQSYQDYQSESYIKKDVESFALDPNIYGGSEKDEDNDQFALILWNDEKHSFADVIEVVMRATRRRQEYGKFIAEEVDKHGRKIVSTSSDISHLLTARSIIDRIQLAASIRSMRDTFREEMCETIFVWLNDLAGSTLVGNRFALRDIICEAFCDNWRVGSTATRVTQPLHPIPGHFQDTDDDFSVVSGGVGVQSVEVFPQSEDMSPTVSDGSTPNPSLAPSYWTNSDDGEFCSATRARQDIADMSDFESVLVQSPSGDPVRIRKSKRARIEYFLLFDLRFWKLARYALRDLFISTMISNAEYRFKMGLHFAHLYPQVIELYVLADREPDCSIAHLSTQMFTCPTIATVLAKKHFTMLCAVLYSYLTKNRVGLPSSVNLTASIPEDRRSLQNRRLQLVFFDIDYILTRNLDKGSVSCDESRIHQVADLLLLLEGCAPFIRQINEHVEYESTEWVSFFQVTALLLKMARLVAQWCNQGQPDSSRKAIRLVSRMLTSWSLGFMRDRFSANEVMNEPHFQSLSCDDFSNVSYPIVQFPVEFYVLSIHHPLHAFLSWLIEFGTVESPNQLKSLLSFSIIDSPEPGRSIVYGPEDMLILMLDYPLRTLVAIAQIRVNLWVRNGYTLRTHQVHYRDVTMRDTGYARDIFGVQTMMTTCNPSRVMLTIIERWSLMSWLKGSVEHAAFDEGRLLYILEEFLHGLIVLLSERMRLTGNDDQTTRKLSIKREIIQVLCFEPLPFSDICRKMPDHLTSHEEFEPVLKEISIFKAPEGLNDTGTYELKSEYLDEVDVYFFHYTPTQWDAAEHAVKSAVKKKTGRAIESIVVEPHLRPITYGAFTSLGWIVGTPEFAQMIFVTLSNVIFRRISNSSSLPESLLSLTLYLCHLAVIEDQICVPDLERKLPTFSYNACVLVSHKVGPSDDGCQTILEILNHVHNSSEFENVKAVAERILHLIKENEPEMFESASKNIIVVEDTIMEDDDAETEAERKKREAKERKARVLAEFQKRQQAFADKNLNTFEFSDDEEVESDAEEAESYKFPSGDCILCRKPVSESEIYGTVGFVTESTLFRQAPFGHSGLMSEMLQSGPNLDRPVVEDSNRHGDDVGQGFPNSCIKKEPVTVSCGHVIHLRCFEEYKETIALRHRQHITRNPPERVELGEFLCPLCKSLNNIFLPLVFKNIQKTLDSELEGKDFSEWITDDVWNVINQLKSRDSDKISSTNLNNFARTNILDSVNEILLPSYSEKLSPTLPSRWMPVLFPRVGEEPRLGSQELESLRKVYAGNINVLSELERTCCEKSVTKPSNYYNLIKSYGATVSSMEIALRGANKTESTHEIGISILDQISQRNMILLRILHHTALTYGQFCVIEGAEKSQASNEFSKIMNQQIGKLFFGQECMYDTDSVSCPDIVLPLLMEDLFLVLAESSVCLKVAMNAEFQHLLLLCYVAQIIKMVYMILEHGITSNWLAEVPQQLEVDGVCDSDSEVWLDSFMAMIAKYLGMDKVEDYRSLGMVPRQIYAIIERFTLPFLRKSALLAYVTGAVGYNGETLIDVGGGEIRRLQVLLKLPSIEEVFHALLPDSESDSNKTMLDLVSRWCQHLSMAIRRPLSLQTTKMCFEYPSVLHLLRLPNSFHEFFQQVGSMKCQNCNTSPEDPGICLFCGALVCCQNYCCGGGGEVGECNAHMKSCAGYIGIFLLIKKCSVLFLRKGSGVFTLAPYLDVHGEVDPNLKRGRPLYLNQRRYDHLIRDQWLQNLIASQIARKIEGTVDNGGWEGM
ncbi:hypothetical protein V1514DRAFT_327359 [Lipomyces japonicus]|uniref:uncharacterized protein n=1 Tax=Lipomyces japonicus TaxID=56871 RepID=UPI0034CE6F39